MQQRVVLSAADRAQLSAQASRGLVQALLAQGFMGVVAALIAGVVGGAQAAWSALAGLGVYLIPNALFALRLLVSVVKADAVNPFTFLFGEVLKLLTAVLLLGLLVRVAQEHLIWWAMLLGLIFTLKGYFLLLVFRKLS